MWRSDSAKSARSEAASSLLSPPGSANATTATSTHTPPRRRSRVSISEPSEGNNSGSGSHHASTATSAAWRARAGRQPAVTSPTTRRTFTATNAATAAGAAATSSSTRDRDRSRHKTTTPRTAAAAATRTRMTATAAAAAVRVVTGFRANVMHEYHGHLPRVGHTALLYERDVYVFGGVSDKDTYSNSLYCHEKRSLQWREVRSVGVTPSGRAHHSAVLCEHRMLIYGGHRGCDVFDDVYAYDFVSRRWDKMPAARPHAPGPVFLHAAVYVPTTQSMAVLGGFHQREYNVYLGHMYDVRNRVWCGVPPPPLHDPQQLQLVTAAYVATRDAVVVLGLVDAHTAAAAAAAAATTSSAVGGAAAATATTAAAAAAESPLSVSSPTSSLLPSTTASAVAAYKQQQQQQSSVQLPPPSVYLLNVHTLVWTRVTTTAAPESPIPFRMHDVWRVFVHDLVRMGGGYYDGWQEVWYFALDLQAVQQALLLRGDSREGSALHVRNSDVFNSNNNVRHSGASGADGGLATWLPDVFAGNNNNNNNNGSSGGVSSHSPWLHHASPPDSPRAASASSPLATATTTAAAVLSSSSAAHTTRPQYGFFKLQLSDMTWSIVPAHLPQRLRAQLEVRAREGADRRRTPATMTVTPLPVSRRQGSGGSHNSSIDGLAMPTTIAQWRSSATAPSPLSAVSSPLPVSALSTRTTRRARLFSVHGEPPYQRKYVLTAFRESSSSSSSSRSKRSSHGATAATTATRVPRLQYLILHGGLHPDEADYAMYMFTPTVTRLDALSAHKLVELPDSVQSIVASSSSSSHTTSGIARWLVTSKSGNSKTAMMMAGQRSSDSNSNDEDDDDDDDNAERSAASDTVLTAGASLSDATGPFARVGSPAELLSISDGSMDVVHALSTQQQQQQSQQSQHTPMRRARKQASGDGSGGAAAVHVGLVRSGGGGVGATRDGNNNNDVNSNNSVHVGGLYSRPARQRRRSSGGVVSSPLTAHDGDGVDAARVSPLLPTLLPPPRFALLHHAQNATTALTTTAAAAATTTTTTAATSAGAALRDRGRLSLQRQRQQQQQQQKQQQQQQQHLMPYPNCPVVVLERDADVQAWARQLYTGTRAWLARTLGDAVADDARLRRLQRRLLERTRRRVQKSGSSSTGNSGNSGSSRRVGGASEGARRGRRGSRSSNNSNSAADSNNNKDSRSAAATRRRGSGGNAQSPHASPLRGRVARTTTTSSSSQQQRGRRRSSTSSGGSARGGGGNSNKRSNSGGGDGDDDDDDDDRDGGDGSDEDDELLSSLLQTYNSSNSGGGGADDGSRLLDDELAAMAEAAGLSPLSLRRYPTRRGVARAGGKQQHNNNNNNNNNSSDEDDKDTAAATQSSADFFARRRLHTFTLQELSRACDDEDNEAALRGDDEDEYDDDDGSRGGGADGKDEREAERAGQMLTEHWLRLPGIERLRLSVTKRRGEQQRLPTSIFQRGTLAGTHVSDLGSAVAYVLLRNALAALGNDTTAAARAARARRRWAFLRALVRTGEATFLLYRARQQHARLQGVPVTSTPALLMAPELTMVGVVRAVAVPTRPVPYALPQPSLQPPRHTRMTESGMVVYSNAVTLAPLSRVSGDGGRTAAAATTTSAAHVYRSWS